MSNFLKIWKGIIQNPFDGFAQVNKDTKIALPLLCLLLLVLISTAMLLPLMMSNEYITALGRVQMEQMRQKGVELSDEQAASIKKSLAAPAMKIVTIVSTFGGGLGGYVGILLLVTLLMKVLTLIIKSSVSYKLLFKILVFAGIVGIVQRLLKSGITLAGDWSSALRRVQTTEDLKLVLQSSVSLTLLFSYKSLGKVGYYLLDTISDIFNWIYYIFLYAGLKRAAGLDKNKALIITIISAGVFVAAGAVFVIVI
ncbi:MAG: YIP1 family protein [Spirochaetota bacterium]